ncbi:hypothetical protein AAG570_005677 [Ranatra chinensis]|uniref:Uncharacterized protein n=1 Tax=Ranatra chinensis TaxID=642074 RepID=A0ABD0XY54_9HEMI
MAISRNRLDRARYRTPRSPVCLSDTSPIISVFRPQSKRIAPVEVPSDKHKGRYTRSVGDRGRSNPMTTTYSSDYGRKSFSLFVPINRNSVTPRFLKNRRGRPPGWVNEEETARDKEAEDKERT